MCGEPRIYNSKRYNFQIWDETWIGLGKLPTNTVFKFERGRRLLSCCDNYVSLTLSGRKMEMEPSQAMMFLLLERI